MMNSEIFREYDIRGVAERDLTFPVVESLGRAFAEHVRPKGIVTVAVGYDARLSSPRLRDALIAGLIGSGMTVIDLGLCPTPALYFSLHYLNPGAGIMITGSHNPPEFNGFKLCVDKDPIYGEEIQKLKRLTEAACEKGRRPRTNTGGTLLSHPILPDYINSVVHRFPQLKKSPIKVVLDSGNGTAGLAAPAILREIGCEVIELFSEPNGRFPHHHPDPTIPENLSTLIDTVRAQGADAGIAFDGDADRIGVIDETGTILWGDQLMIVFARDILSHDPNARFLSEVKCSQVLYDDIRSRGGTIQMWKAGHSLLRAKMKEVGSALAGEMSGHLFFADRYFGFDDAIYAACRVVEILKKIKANSLNSNVPGSRQPSLSSLLADLPKTFTTPEIRIDCPDTIKFKVVDRLKKTIAEGGENVIRPGEIITIDGIRAVFTDGWGLVRASNTQPVLVMRFEATNPASLDTIRTVMEQHVKRIMAAERVS